MATKADIIESVQVTNLLLHAAKDPYTIGIIMFQATDVERAIIREVLERARDARPNMSKVA
jgi:hypothetical protein